MHRCIAGLSSQPMLAPKHSKIMMYANNKDCYINHIQSYLLNLFSVYVCNFLPIVFVSLSVHMSVCLWSCALWSSGSAYGLKAVPLYHLVPRMALPIHFFRYLCCRMYHSATTHSKKPSRHSFCVMNSHGQWSRDHGCSRHSIFGGLVLQLYAVWLAFKATTTLLVLYCFTCLQNASSILSNTGLI